jgi:hypothetical protein
MVVVLLGGAFRMCARMGALADIARGGRRSHRCADFPVSRRLLNNFGTPGAGIAIPGGSAVTEVFRSLRWGRGTDWSGQPNAFGS